MQLRFDEYAADPEVRGPAKNATNDALRRVIDYYLYRDLQRGWRVTAPNLEDCGLLVFDYEGLQGEDGLLRETAVWEAGFSIRADARRRAIHRDAAPLRSCPRGIARANCSALFSMFCAGLWRSRWMCWTRRNNSTWSNRRNPRLLEDTVWYLEDARELVKSEVAYPRPRASRIGTGILRLVLWRLRPLSEDGSLAPYMPARAQLRSRKSIRRFAFCFSR